MRWIAGAWVVAGSVGLVAACNEDPVDACDSCDPETDYCAIYHSDVAGEDPATTCQPLPDGCEDDPTCDCLSEAAADDAGLEFCITEGGCSEPDGVAIVNCPGG
jgi:hypothetical protein